MLRRAFVAVVVIYELINGIEIPADYKYNECAPEKKECEYWLELKEKLTMIYKKELLYPFNGDLFLYNESPGPNATKVSCLEYLVL